MRIVYKGELSRVYAAWQDMKFEFRRGESRAVSPDLARALLAQADKFEEVTQDGTGT